MDIFIHLFLIVLIGLFFFLDKYTPTQNPLFIVILISFFGFILLQTSDIEYIDYHTVQLVNGTTDSYEHPKTILNDVGMGIFTVQSFMVLVYWFFMILAVINVIIGKKGEIK